MGIGHRETDKSKPDGRIRLHAHFYVAGVLLLVGIFGFNYWFAKVGRLRSASEAVPLKQPLATVAKELGQWVVVGEEPLSKEVEYIAGVDDYINRFYGKTDNVGNGMRERISGEGSEQGSDDKGPKDALHVYVAYFGGIHLAAPHSPDVCMQGAGWKIASAYRRTVELAVLGRTEKIGVKVHVFNRDYDRRVVVWWDYVHGKNVTNPFWERIRWVLPLFLGGKAGSVVQVQIAKDIKAGQQEDAIYEIIIEFAKLLAPEVGKCLPEPM